MSLQPVELDDHPYKRSSIAIDQSGFQQSLEQQDHITRHGRPIARIVPEVDNRAAEIRKAMDRIAAFRQTMPRLSVEEILSARHEGHKY